MDKDQLCIDLANLSFYDFECVLGRRIKKKKKKKKLTPNLNKYGITLLNWSQYNYYDRVETNHPKKQ